MTGPTAAAIRPLLFTPTCRGEAGSAQQSCSATIAEYARSMAMRAMASSASRIVPAGLRRLPIAGRKQIADRFLGAIILRRVTSAQATPDHKSSPTT
jgi:hypothetical protein